MLTSEQKYIIHLLRKSFNLPGVAVTVPSDLEMVNSIIQRNGILLTAYQFLPTVLQQSLEQAYLVAVSKSIQQEYWGEQVLEKLSNAGFDCIALKGWELRKLYPETSMRQMTDLDILVRPYEFDKLFSVLKGIGFSVEDKSSHFHDSFARDGILVEMHKRLTDDSDAIQAWEREMWEHAVPDDGNIYKMSPEDFYIYHFVHLHIDYMCGSLGLRRIADTWLLQKQTVNMEQVKAVLEKFGIWPFHQHMVKLCRATMGEISMDEDSEFLLKHAFMHGLYGSINSHRAARIAKAGEYNWFGKTKSVFVTVFPPYKRMKAQFPVLEKWPMLMPWCWFMRINHFLHGDRKQYKEMLDYRGIKESDYQEMKRFFKAGGVE